MPRGIFDPPSKVNAAVSAAMDPVVHTAMQNDPARRYQTAAGMREAIVRAETAPAGPGRFSRRAAAVAALMLLLLSGGGVLIARPRSAPPPGFEAGPAARLAPTAAKLEAGFAMLTRPGTDLAGLRGWTADCDDLGQKLVAATGTPDAAIAFLSR